MSDQVLLAINKERQRLTGQLHRARAMSNSDRYENSIRGKAQAKIADSCLVGLELIREAYVNSKGDK